MTESNNMSNTRLPSVKEALFIMLITLFVLVGGVLLGGGEGVEATFFPLFLATGVVVLAGFYLGYNWENMQKGIIEAISKVTVAMIILLLIGTIIGLWVASGTIPSLIYYGLKIVSPSFFLGATFLITALMSLSTGSSWGTIGSAGVAVMGIGIGLDVPVGITAGAVVSGALFGDKMSPLSDTTNMAAGITEVNLFKHIRSMVWTTGPAALIVFMAFWIVGSITYSGTASLADIEEMQTGLEQGWNINPIHLLIIIIMLIGRKIPSLITLFLGAFVGGLWALLFQSSTLHGIFVAATTGFESNTGIEAVDETLSIGGITSMQDIVVIIILSTALGGVLQSVGVLDVLVKSLVSKVKSIGGLVSSVLGSSYILAFLSGSQALPIILPGLSFQKAFDDRNIDRSVLSRSLEDAGTIIVPLVPWGAMTGFISATLGVKYSEYWPFLWLTFLVPIIAIFYAITGIAIWKIKEK